jgi:hypothetical protein
MSLYFRCVCVFFKKIEVWSYDCIEKKFLQKSVSRNERSVCEWIVESRFWVDFVWLSVDFENLEGFWVDFWVKSREMSVYWRFFFEILGISGQYTHICTNRGWLRMRNACVTKVFLRFFRNFWSLCARVRLSVAPSLCAVPCVICARARIDRMRKD